MSENHKGSETEKSENRTRWAEDRTVLANERTFSSRMGFALGSLGVALGSQSVFKDVEPTWLAKLGASIFVILAVYVAILNYLSCEKMLKRLNSHSAEPSSRSDLKVVTALMCVGAAFTALVLWVA